MKIGLHTLLFLTFLILKLTHVISWSWWWVTAPLWIPFGIFALVVALVTLAIFPSKSKNRGF